MVEAHADMVRSESTHSPTIGRAGHLGTGAPKGTTLDVLVALVIVAAMFAGGAYLYRYWQGARPAPPPGDHTSPPDTPGT